MLAPIGRRRANPNSLMRHAARRECSRTDVFAVCRAEGAENSYYRIVLLVTSAIVRATPTMSGDDAGYVTLSGRGVGVRRPAVLEMVLVRTTLQHAG